MEQLSDECLRLILQLLPHQDRVTAGQVSRQLRVAARDAVLWSDVDVQVLPGCDLPATRRLLLFAPVLHHLELHHLWGKLTPSMRRALADTSCRVQHLTVHLTWPLFPVTAAMLRAQRGSLEELTLYPCYLSLRPDSQELAADVLGAIDSSRIRRLSVSSCVATPLGAEETPFSWALLDTLQVLRVRDSELWSMRPLLGPRSVGRLISRNKLSLRVVQMEQRMCRELTDCSGLRELRVGVDGELRRLSELSSTLEEVTAVWRRSSYLGIGYLSRLLADSPLPGRLSRLKVEIDNESASFDGRLLPFVRHCGQWITGLSLIGMSVGDEEFVQSLTFLPRLRELSVELWDEDPIQPAMLSTGKLRGWSRGAVPALLSLTLWRADCPCAGAAGAGAGATGARGSTCTWGAAVRALEQERPGLRVYFRRDGGCFNLRERVVEERDSWYQ